LWIERGDLPKCGVKGLGEIQHLGTLH